MDPIYLDNVRGGLNNNEPAASIGDNQLVTAQNIDLDRSTLAGRRGGHEAVTTSGLSTKVPFVFRHLPENSLADAELWAVSTSGTTSVWARKTTAWSLVTPTGINALDVSEGQYAIRAASHGGKLFLAYPSASGTDRLHVWDGTSIRPTGLAEPPAAPVVTDSGTGTFSGTRWYRVRYTKQVSSVTVLRSEPSEVTEFEPDLASEAAQITKPSAINEGETHWEIEESVTGENGNFYRIATVVVGTTTYNDTLEVTEVATQGTLSADVGDYSLQWSSKFVLVDEDRVLIAGSWEQENYGSRVGWSPVGLAPGVGNDERIEEDTDPFLDLDNKDGGEITDFQGPLFGYIYAFKYQKIYKLVRTQNRIQAYNAVPLSDAFGAIPGTACPGRDQFGRPALYFVDPFNGPCRISAQGIERCGHDIQGTWETVNLQADVVARTVYYPDTEQVWFYLATNGSSTPNVKLKLHTRYVGSSQEGLRGGWTLDTGDYMGALSTCLYSTNVNAGTARVLALKPIIGTSISGALIAMADTGTADNDTQFVSKWRTGLKAPLGYVRKFGVRAGNLVASPIVSGEVSVTLVRDAGREEVSKTIDLSPNGAQTTLIQPIDNLALTDMFALQVELGDVTSPPNDWAADSLSLVLSPEESL